MHALEQSNYVQSHAADRLGTTRRILKYKMDQLGMAEDGGDARSSMAS
jgi:transcriptional regulator with GAF, ATPase, and Fis domain